MAISADPDKVAHADAFSGVSSESDAACAELPLTLRVEALLLASDRPLGDARLIELLGLLPSRPVAPRKSGRGRTRGSRSDSTVARTDAVTPDDDADVPEDPGSAKERRHAIDALHGAIAALNESYASTQRSFRIEAIASGWHVMTIPALGPLLSRLRGERQYTRLSQPALETLAIIAYRQPILRADLEAIRGVACGEILKSLMDRRLVRIVGRAEEVGRPMLYGTTKEFLRIFGIANIGDLPHGKDLKQ